MNETVMVQRKDKKIFIFLASFFGTMLGLCFFCFVMPFAIFLGITTAVITGTNNISYEYLAGNESSKNKILVIRIEGVILGDKNPKSDFWESLIPDTYTYGYQVKNQLINAVEDDSIKGVILTIDSPGGTIYGAQAIYDGVEYFKAKTQKPVVTYVEGMAASGAYWGALSSDLIFADYGSSIGSIGVISGPFEYYDTVLSEDYGNGLGGVLTQNGIESFYISAGTSKDLGNPFRRMTEKEIQVLQTGVNNEYKNFVKLVSEDRDISEDTIRNEIGALIYDNEVAENYKLIDKTMSRDDVYNEIINMARLDSGDVQFIYQDSGFSEIKGLVSSFVPDKAEKEVASICSSGKKILAYSGDISSLCK